ncbi:4-hydroxy-tetrahydrodipicolinate synthase [Tenuibacillus multivorans]|uniref:4-hydroxy-tetrahydrodipicolinate synthase n=1 Tax=Tenuibacillus multivorans TaxID=237069 RepID=A0A1G9WIR9_9BACI|nr:4-hydroxy-tetrahydrodipicolinate synthase [Tenuibacillus multivorans]GEL76484.1 4-hydroxy-tetrahydrodipicolinate synthase [Tenuibacillus multivorans]SDM84444.1 4-hydroxy-tetrahydrodipicolinate synthase [Tenuibacillus multivorans]
MNFGQVLTAMVTPFDEHGELDFEAMRGLINYLIANGSDGLVIAGTTGESPTLTHDEKLQVFKFTVEEVNGRVPVIAGTGSNNTKASLELSKEAEAIGVDAIMLVTPYYNKPSQEGMYQHFSVIAQSVSVPVMLYNIPGRSVVNMSVDTIVRLSQVENIVSIKEASGDLDRVTQIVNHTADDFSVYSGEDSQSLPTLAVGGTGIVSVSAHVIGNEMQEMVRSYRKGDVTKAASIHGYVLPMMKAIFSAPSPTPVKEALNRIGVPVGSVRLPLIPLNEEERASLYHILDQLKNTKVAG